MKKTLFTFLILCLGFQMQAQVQIGEGTETDIHLPMAPYWNYSYTQVIYTAQEIGINEPQQLTKIAYKYNGANAWSDHAKIFIGHTSLNEFTDATWVGHDQLTQVYDGEFSVPNQEMWVEFQFNTPFLYNGTDNLIIAVWDDSDATGAHGVDDDFYCTDVDPYRGMMYRNDHSNFDVDNPPTPMRTGYFANIKMWFGEAQSEAEMAIGTDTINFGDVLLGETVSQNLVISNIGGAPLEITNMTCVGEDSAFFTFEPQGNISIASGQSQEIQISYTASEEGEHQASLQITSNGGDGEVAFTASSISPYITTFPYQETFANTSHDFPLGWVTPDDLWYIGGSGVDDDRCAAVFYNHVSGDALLITPPFVLPNAAQISFWWKNSDISAAKVAPYDSLFFEISNNGGQTWTSVDTLAPEMQLMAFEEVQLSLAEYAQDTVYFRWRHKTDNSYNAFGAGVDNISITYNEENNNPPTNLAATVDAYNVNLTWAIPEGDTTLLEGYNVYRDQEKINTDIITELQYTDTLATNGTYQYYVTAVYQNNESEPGNMVEVTIAVNNNPPTNLTATVDLYNVSLTWAIPEGDTTLLEGYNVYRDQEKINTAVITALQYADTLATNGTYQYYVTAVYQHNESASSDTVDVTIMVAPSITVSVAAINQEVEEDDTAQQSFAITNSGNATLSFNIEVGNEENQATTPDWLTVDVSSGELAPEATSDIMLTFDANDLEVGTYSARLIINHNVPAQDSIVVPVTLQVEEQDGLASEEQFNLGVYPNPCSHVMHITAADNINHIQVFNNQGQLVQSISSINDKMYKMDMSTLPKGMYIVECAIANKVIMKKIIKQ